MLDIRLSAEGEHLRLNVPKGVLTDQLRWEIADRKQELLEFLRNKSVPAPFNPPPIGRCMGVNPVPLSFAQERLWFLEQLEPGAVVYNLCRAYRLTGELKLLALETSLNEIVRRHEVLRSSIRVVDGRSVQVVQPPYELKLSIINLQGMSDVECDQNMRQRILQAAEAPFDFAVGKFLRAELLRVADDEHVLILATHHIAADAWSMGILTRELWSLYETYRAGRSPQLKEPPLQYADFAVWQRDWLGGDVLESQISYWKEQLNDLPILNLPTDRPRLSQQSFHGARVPITLANALSSAINELSAQYGVTPFMTLLSAFQVLLYRYTGQEHVVVGSPISNRGRPELDPLIGFFVNTLVLRSDLSGNPSFKELVARVREVCLGAYAHQDLPFEKLVLELQPERDQSRNPLFQVMFVLQNATRPFGGIPGLRIEPFEIESTRSLFDLSLFLRERNGKYTGYVEYSMNLFNRDRIERMAGHFQTLLEGIVANPEQPVSTLPILTDSERHKILIEWNETAADYPRDKCIHELFEEQVERTPDAIAVEFEGQQLTYWELNRRSNKLAHHLINLGIGPGKMVGICLERSLEMLVGLLGILKAGGAYVPLDSAYPKERLMFMLTDAQVSVLLTQDSIRENRIRKTEGSVFRSSIPNPGPTIVCLDRDAANIEQQDAENPKSRAGSENLSYVIYTSGSTGYPKGVQVTHRSVVNCLCSIGEKIGLSHQDIWLAVTTISFDIAGLELYLPLISRAKVVLANREESLEGSALAALLKTCKATVMQATPITWTMLLDAGWEASEKFKILCGGEVLSRLFANRLLANRASIWNVYGPTEATIWSTIHRVEPGNEPVSVGRPIANTQMYVLDAHTEPVPIGVHGELYIGGDGLARGYLNNPVLTSEGFIANPFNKDLDTGLYRTGDYASFRPDGNIEFLGRTDNQVKIRGCRIELGEIEAALMQYPAIQETVVVAQDRGSFGEKDLIGYFVPRRGLPIEIAQLRSFLREKLPDFMVPYLFVELDALPRLPNGKLDPTALQSHDTRSEPQEAHVEPRTQVEELLTQIWEEVLQVREVGIYDNFFDLGGHSLIAIQIISQVREAFDKDVPLSALFDAPTVTGLAATIEKTVSGRFNELPPIIGTPHDGPIPLSMNQEQLWRLDRIVPGTDFFNMSYVYRLTGDLNVEALERAVAEIVRRHEVLRTVFSSNEEKPLQVVNPVGHVHLSIVDLRSFDSEVKSQEAAKLVVDERSQGFDLGKGPLVRIKLIQLTATESLFALTLHHIISDQSSVRRIREEIVILYDAFCRKEKSPLAEPQIQFADYAVWERKLLQEGFFDHQISYWKERLSRPSTGVVVQRPRSSTSLYFRRDRIELDEGLFKKVRAFGHAQLYTPFMIILAALGVLIYCQTGQPEVWLGTLVANRGRRETAPLIGYLTNTVLLKLEMSSSMTVEELLTHTRRVTLSALAHEDLPFEYLAQTLGAELNSQRAFLFQTLLIYQRGSFESAETGGLRFAQLKINQEKVEAEVAMSMFPLILRLHETSTMLTGTVNYKSGSFGSKQISRMKHGIDAVLRQMVSDSINRVSIGSLVALF